MAMVVRVKPEYNGKIAVQSSNSYNGIILSNDLSQATLVQIYNTEDELRDFLYTTYTTVGDSYAPSQIDPSLIHAYASEEITHNPAKTDYPANTVGKHLNETRGKIDSFDNAFVRPSTRPSFFMDFANGAFHDNRFLFARNSPATYIDKNGVMKLAGVNSPRFTYDPVTKECLGFLYEFPRTNYVVYRSFSGFVDGYWVKPTTTQVELDVMNQPQALSFTIDANNCKGSPNSNLCGYIFINTAVPVGSTVSVSMYIKADTACKVKFGIDDNSASNVSVTTTYQKISYTGQVATGNRLLMLAVDRLLAGNVDGTRVYICCPQVEIGSDSTSYIPPVNNQATLRSLESWAITDTLFSTIFPNISEGTLFVSAYGSAKNGEFGKYAWFTGPTTAGGNNHIGAFNNGVVGGQVYVAATNNGVNQYVSANEAIATGAMFNMTMAWSRYYTKAFINGIEKVAGNSLIVPPNINKFEIGSTINTIIRQVAFWPRVLTEAEQKSLSSISSVSGKSFNKLPSIGDMSRSAFVSPEAILRAKSRQEFSVDGTGASVTRNIRRDYDFTFEIVDSSGVTLTAQPASSCTAGTDNALTFTAPLGKTLTYAITPVYEN